MKFTIRDLLWLTLAAASLTGWWRMNHECSDLREDVIAKSIEIAAKSRDLETAAKVEKSLRKEVELLGQIVRNRESQLKQREAELSDSLQRREAVLEALRTMKSPPLTSP